MPDPKDPTDLDFVYTPADTPSNREPGPAMSDDMADLLSKVVNIARHIGFEIGKMKQHHVG